MEVYWDENELTTSQITLLNRVISAVIEYEGIADDCEVSISFITADEIRALNRDYRGKDSATDVLSFPVSSDLAIGDGHFLGDIAICLDVAKQQAIDYGHSLERELSFLVVHGLLHLLGYDHVTDETEMFTIQDEILSALNINRA